MTFKTLCKHTGVGRDDDLRIRAFSSDESLKVLGDILGNESSRNIVKALINRKMYVNEIAKELDLRPNLVVHHLHKMESIGLVDITYKKITKKGIDHRYFGIPKGLLALPGMQRKDEDRLMKRIRGSLRFVAIGIAGLVPLALRTADIRTDPGADSDTGLPLTGALAAGLLVVVIGLVSERIYAHLKK